jgi:hypothetical protein
VVTTVAGGAVAVLPPSVRRKKVFQRGKEVVVGAGACLDDRDARRGVRHEDVQQPVAAFTDILRRVVGEVEHGSPGAGADGDHLAVHAVQSVGWSAGAQHNPGYRRVEVTRPVGRRQDGTADF